MLYKTFDEVFTFETIYKAHIRGRRSKRRKKPIIRFEINVCSHIYELYERIASGKYEISPYNSFMINVPKRRQIQTVRYQDRVIQHALCDEALAPYFTSHAIADNCACQKGKGAQYARRRLQSGIEAHIKKYGTEGYFLKGDILKYFPSIPHENLKALMRKHIYDDKLYNFLCYIISSYHTAPEYLKKYSIPSCGEGPNTCRGIPIGNQTSQVFGMFYLDEMDRFVKETKRVKIYSRYMDDFVMLHHDKSTVKTVLDGINLIVEELGLKLNNKTQISPMKNGITYLGFRFKVTADGKVIQSVIKPTRKRLRRRAYLAKKAYDNGIISADRVYSTLVAVHGHLNGTNSQRFEREIREKLKFALAGKVMRQK